MFRTFNFYFATRKQKYYFCLWVASAFTIIDILHKKIGGLLSGANYSDSHTWQEIYEMAPRFLAEFGFIYFLFLAYFLLAKEETEVICPKCEDNFTTKEVENTFCSKCDVKVKELKNYKKEIQKI